MNLTNRYSPVPHRRMVLGEVVGQIVGATAPVDEELALGDVVFDPVEAHVDGFGAALLDSVVDDAFGTGVVSLDWSGGLGPAHGDECVSKDTGVLGVDEEGAEFGFGGRCHDVAQFVANSMDGAVGRWICGRRFCRVTGVRAEIVMAADAAASFGHRYIGCVAIDVEDHVACGVHDLGIGVGGGIVEEPEHFGEGFLGGVGLCGSDRAKSDQHSAVDSHGVVEKSAGDLLDKPHLFLQERSAVIRVVSILDFGAIGGLVPGVWCILATLVPFVLKFV